MLIGQKSIDTLSNAHVAVFGVGGVGGYAVEVLARSGIGSIDLIDNDQVSLSNINRQILALRSTMGQMKVDVAERRIHDINPDCKVTKHAMFYLPENADEIDLSQFDYVIDCIDTITAKINLAQRCYELHVPIISSMGAANKMDPTAFKVVDIFQTEMDPIAKVMRKKFRKLGIDHLKVVYSTEQPVKPQNTEGEYTADTEPQSHRRSVPASNAFVPAAAGIIVGGEVVKDLIGFGHEK